MGIKNSTNIRLIKKDVKSFISLSSEPQSLKEKVIPFKNNRYFTPQIMKDTWGGAAMINKLFKNFKRSGEKDQYGIQEKGYEVLEWIYKHSWTHSPGRKNNDDRSLLTESFIKEIFDFMREIEQSIPKSKYITFNHSLYNVPPSDYEMSFDFGKYTFNMMGTKNTFKLSMMTKAKYYEIYELVLDAKNKPHLSSWSDSVYYKNMVDEKIVRLLAWSILTSDGREFFKEWIKVVDSGTNHHE